MKKVLLCVMIVALSVSAAFGGTVQDLLNEINSARESSGSNEQITERVNAILTPERIKAVISSGDDINAKDKYGTTALILAVQYSNNPEVVKTLIEGGADVNAKDNDGKDVAAYVQNNKNPEIRDMFKVMEFGGEKTALINAAQKNAYSSDSRSLIEAGADIHATNQNGATALMIAAANTSYPDVIKILTEAGIDVNAKSNDGQTALMYAARFNPKPKILRAILNAGADINAKDSLFFGKTAKDYAAESGASQEVIKILEGL